VSPRVVPGTCVGGRDGVRLGAGTVAQRRVDRGAGQAAVITAVPILSRPSERCRLGDGEGVPADGALGWVRDAEDHHVVVCEEGDRGVRRGSVNRRLAWAKEVWWATRVPRSDATRATQGSVQRCAAANMMRAGPEAHRRRPRLG
jgi:hypothetical protein